MEVIITNYQSDECGFISILMVQQEKGKLVLVFTVKDFLRNLSNALNFDAEIHAIKITISNILCLGTTFRKLVIFIDSQTAILVIQKWRWAVSKIHAFEIRFVF